MLGASFRNAKADGGGSSGGVDTGKGPFVKLTQMLCGLTAVAKVILHIIVKMTIG